MSKAKHGPGRADEWESGNLGRDVSSVRRSTLEAEIELDAALGLQMISLRVHKDLLKQLKLIASFHGVGYQPMIRGVLGRWARSELVTIAREAEEHAKARRIVEERHKNQRTLKRQARVLDAQGKLRWVGDLEAMRRD